MDWALAQFDEQHAMTEFSAAYSAATSQLADIAGRNPIARWAELGGFSVNTIKGKDFFKEILKGCVHVLPSHGLGRNIGRRNSLSNSNHEHPICQDLLDKLTAVLEA